MCERPRKRLLMMCRKNANKKRLIRGDDLKENSFDCLPNSSRTLASFHVTQLRVRLFVVVVVVLAFLFYVSSDRHKS